MLRKLNFTERVKVPRSNVRFTLHRDGNGVLSFTPQVSFEGVAAVPTARVFIEAYYRTSFMRFDCGSVEAFRPPEDLRLADLDATSVVRFRVKIVDNTTNEHRIVAVADDIVVAEEQPQRTGRLPLLPVNFTDALEQQAWRIAFETNGPVLELNNRIPGIKDVARNEAAFAALVYPAAVRQILMQIVLVDEHDTHDDGDEWWNLWLRWAVGFSPSLPRNTEEAPFWIEDVIASFCARQSLIDRWHAARAEGA